MKRTPENFKRLFALRKRKGWTWRELAAHSHVPQSTLLLWSRRLRRASEEQARFAQVEIVEPASASSALELVLKCGARILVDPGFDPEHLRRVVAALDRTC